MGITLMQVLELVGKLDDAPGNEVPRERFRHFLKENLNEVGQVRDYVQECLNTSGDQYNRALQDLVNHLGHFLGFEVTFGRYKGAEGQIGFDGHWVSQPTGFHVVVEVKTTEVYAVKTSTLAGYVDTLISEKIIPDREHALGLYVVGRTDPEINQLENAILAEKRTQHMRIISVDSLLSLAEMMTDYDVSHPDALAVLRPSGPRIDQVVDLMARLVAQGKVTPVEEPTGSTRPADRLPEEQVAEPPPTVQTAYWLTPVRTDEGRTAEECIETLVGQEKLYAFGERTPGRKRIKPGDWICFYATAKGVVAHAKVATSPEKKAHPEVGEDYPWIFSLESPKLYLDSPVAIDAAMRNQLNVFKGRDPEKSWAWFVQATRAISEHDFHLLTANP